jgi:hypothetical protein
MREDPLAADTTPSVTPPAPLPPRRLHCVSPSSLTTVTTPSPLVPTSPPSPLRHHHFTITSPRSPRLSRFHQRHHLSRFHHSVTTTSPRSPLLSRFHHSVTTCPDSITPSPPLHHSHRTCPDFTSVTTCPDSTTPSPPLHHHFTALVPIPPPSPLRHP